MKEKQQKEKVQKGNKTIIKIIIIIILLIICIITSFRTGQKYYDLKNSQFTSSNSEIDTDIAKWKFRVTVVY